MVPFLAKVKQIGSIFTLLWLQEHDGFLPSLPILLITHWMCISPPFLDPISCATSSHNSVHMNYARTSHPSVVLGWSLDPLPWVRFHIWKSPFKGFGKKGNQPERLRRRPPREGFVTETGGVDIVSTSPTPGAHALVRKRRERRTGGVCRFCVVLVALDVAEAVEGRHDRRTSHARGAAVGILGRRKDHHVAPLDPKPTWTQAWMRGE